MVKSSLVSNEKDNFIHFEGDVDEDLKLILMTGKILQTREEVNNLQPYFDYSQYVTTVKEIINNKQTISTGIIFALSIYFINPALMFFFFLLIHMAAKLLHFPECIAVPKPRY